MPSHLLLPVVPGVEVPTELPPCPGLRGEPCRDYQAFANQPADPRSPTERRRPGGQRAGAAGAAGRIDGTGGPAGNPATGGPAQKQRRAKKCRKHRGKRSQGKSRDRRGKSRCHHKKRHKHTRR